MAVPYDDLDPGIRAVVRWLNDNGFHTVDSGDGRTKFTEDGKPLPEWETHDPSYECVMPFPHVFMAVPPEDIATECDRLRDLLVARGVPLEVQGPEQGAVVTIQGTYDPVLAEHPAYVMLMGLDDAGLGA